MVKEVPLSKGHIALVDDEDYERVMRFKWHAHVVPQKKPDWRADTVYGCRSIQISPTKSRHELLHHFILGSRERTDHKDGDGRNNQRSNLRPATQSQNCANRRSKKTSQSRFKGVSLQRERSGNTCWRVVVCSHGTVIQVGRFKDEEAAARAYDDAAREIHGEFAHLNFPERKTA